MGGAGRGGGGGKRGGGGRSAAGRDEVPGEGSVFPTKEAPPAQKPTFTGAADEVVESRLDPYREGELQVTREMLAAEQAAMNNPLLMEPGAYSNLPPIENANRVVKDGLVHVGDKGAPTVVARMTEDQAIAHFTSLGMPNERAMRNLTGSGDLPALAALVPKGSKYLGEGVEGVGFALPGGKTVLRIQHGEGAPLLAADVGPAGVYANWKAKYGNTWVESKEAMAMQQKWVGTSSDPKWTLKSGQMNAETMKFHMDDNILNKWKKNVEGLDDHSGNIGIDYSGRMRVLDSGAYRPPIDRRVTADWGDDPKITPIFTYTNKVKRK